MFHQLWIQNTFFKGKLKVHRYISFWLVQYFLPRKYNKKVGTIYVHITLHNLIFVFPSKKVVKVSRVVTNTWHRKSFQSLHATFYPWFCRKKKCDSPLCFFDKFYGLMSCEQHETLLQSFSPCRLALTVVLSWWIFDLKNVKVRIKFSLDLYNFKPIKVEEKIRLLL